MSISKELAELKELHESGALTDEEFAAAKEKLLGLEKVASEMPDVAPVQTDKKATQISSEDSDVSRESAKVSGGVSSDPTVYVALIMALFLGGLSMTNDCNKETVANFQTAEADSQTDGNQTDGLVAELSQMFSKVLLQSPQNYIAVNDKFISYEQDGMTGILDKTWLNSPEELVAFKKFLKVKKARREDAENIFFADWKWGEEVSSGSWLQFDLVSEGQSWFRDKNPYKEIVSLTDSSESSIFYLTFAWARGERPLTNSLIIKKGELVIFDSGMQKDSFLYCLPLTKKDAQQLSWQVGKNREKTLFGDYKTLVGGIFAVNIYP